MRIGFIISLFFIHFVGFSSPTLQTDREISNVTADFSFGQKVIFQARINPPSGLQAIFLYIQPEGQSTRLVTPVSSPSGEIVMNYDLRQNPIRPFTKINYWYQATFPDGSTLESGKFWFDYIDNRYKWLTAKEDAFQVYWYRGDMAFGQMLLNVTKTGLKSAQSFLPISPPFPLKIYVYASTGELQNALQLSKQPWVAGRANPDLGVILLSIPSGPDGRLEMERQIPHEIMHILQFQKTGPGYKYIPLWLVEGSASLAELYPSPDYQRALNKAVESDALLPISKLCDSFPVDASSAFLAYAESASFVKYLHQNYGSSKLVALVERYQDGIGCQEGVNVIFEKSLADLDYDWQQKTLGVNKELAAFQNLSPYLLLLLLLLLIPFTGGILLVHKSTNNTRSIDVRS